MEHDHAAAIRCLRIINATDDAVFVVVNILSMPFAVNVDPALIYTRRIIIDVELELAGIFHDLIKDDIGQGIERRCGQNIPATHNRRVEVARPSVWLGVGFYFHQLVDALAELLVQRFRAFYIRNLNESRKNFVMLTIVGQRQSSMKFSDEQCR